MSTKLSEHFSVGEFVCHCGCGFGGNPLDVSSHLLDLLERIRTRANCPLIILSACRCAEHNRAIGGAEHSAHILGVAADLQWPRGIPPADFVAICEEEVGPGGLGRYSWGLHVDAGSVLQGYAPHRRWNQNGIG